MRSPILLLFLIAAALLGEIPATSAQSPTSYPWCGRFYKDGYPTSCYFTSYERCRTTLSGIGGFCFQSPYYRATPAGGTVTRAATGAPEIETQFAVIARLDRAIQ
jgi:hypothetical protein